MDIETQFEELASLGCHPSIYRRGKKWRVHINAAGNFWADAPSIAEAMRKARRLWDKKGQPLDGVAA